MGYRPWGHNELDMTKATKHAHTGGTEEAGREHKSAEGRHTQLDRGLRSRGWVLGWGEENE